MTLQISDLRKGFGAVQALDGVSFSVDEGTVFGFLGGNGAGKTTTMRIMLDILRADSGSVTWNGVPSTDLPRRTWGYMPEERGLYPRMTVLEQLLYFASLYRVPADRARRDVDAWLERFRIPQHRDRRVEELSKGNQQKIQFLAAILHDPDVLVMDEPFSGLDPVNAAMLRAAFLEMRDRGKTLVFSTHELATVEELCEAVAIVDRGRVVANGPTRDVRRMSGRRLVRLGVTGDPTLPWLSVPDAVVRRPGRDATEIEVGPAVDPSDLLRQALAHGQTVTTFETADPTLEQVFIDLVGHDPAAEERTLASLAAPAEG